VEEGRGHGRNSGDVVASAEDDDDDGDAEGCTDLDAGSVRFDALVGGRWNSVVTQDTVEISRPAMWSRWSDGGSMTNHYP